MIIKQPDLGTALLVSVAGIFRFFQRVILALDWLLLSVAWQVWRRSAWYFVMHDYQKQRVLLTLADPEQDRWELSWNIIQTVDSHRVPVGFW